MRNAQIQAVNCFNSRMTLNSDFVVNPLMIKRNFEFTLLQAAVQKVYYVICMLSACAILCLS